jgi:hypothetical protein
VVVTAGDFVDLRDDLDAGAIGSSRKKTTIERCKRPINNDPIKPDLLEAALEHILSDDYDIWLEVGAALFFELGDDGFELFDRWSRLSPKYDRDQCRSKWPECRKLSRYYTGATILFYADQAAPGWRQQFEDSIWEQFVSLDLKRR